MTTINPNTSPDFTPTTVDPNGPDPDEIPTEPAPVAVEAPDDPEKKASAKEKSSK